MNGNLLVLGAVGALALGAPARHGSRGKRAKVLVQDPVEVALRHAMKAWTCTNGWGFGATAEKGWVDCFDLSRDLVSSVKASLPAATAASLRAVEGYAAVPLSTECYTLDDAISEGKPAGAMFHTWIQWGKVRFDPKMILLGARSPRFVPAWIAYSADDPSRNALHGDAAAWREAKAAWGRVQLEYGFEWVEDPDLGYVAVFHEMRG